MSEPKTQTTEVKPCGKCGCTKAYAGSDDDSWSCAECGLSRYGRIALAKPLKPEVASILHEMRDWILHEYSLPIMEAHHDGHPVESCARRIYDKICKAIEEQEK